MGFCGPLSVTYLPTLSKGYEVNKHHTGLPIGIDRLLYARLWFVWMRDLKQFLFFPGAKSRMDDKMLVQKRGKGVCKGVNNTNSKQTSSKIN